MNHVINQWNSSPSDIVCSPTVNCLNKNSTIIGIKLDILVCGSYGTCLDSTLFGVQVTTGLGFFLHLSYLVYTEDSDSLLYRLRPS